ncbi:MAG: pirin family protein [Proteobacteria bacterium]|nr:MAG: pirin family protein [Pseudomonadota bacterium]
MTTSKLDLVIPPREKDLGGFTVSRILPFASHRMVGPFIFFDHMGPAQFGPGSGMDVRPHPHIGLATVTYLFEGSIHHRDSLGSDQLIKPGDINWMTAGSGIVHSERTPDDVREIGGRMNGLQCWVALPELHEDVAPSFHHYPAKQLPAFKIGNSAIKLLVGKSLGHTSPVVTHSDLFYLEVQIPKGEKFSFEAEGREAAAYLVTGNCKVDEEQIAVGSMAVAKPGEDLHIEATEDSCIMILGGSPVGERFIFWNFVSSSKEKLDRAKAAWVQGPSVNSPHFRPVPGDSKDYIPLP